MSRSNLTGMKSKRPQSRTSTGELPLKQPKMKFKQSSVDATASHPLGRSNVPHQPKQPVEGKQVKHKFVEEGKRLTKELEIVKRSTVVKYEPEGNAKLLNNIPF